MNSAKNLVTVLILTVVVGGMARAQQPVSPPGPSTPDQPVQPASTTKNAGQTVPVVRSIWGIDSPAPVDDPSAFIPDNRPLSGTDVLTVGEPASHSDFFDVSLKLSEGGDTGLINSQQQSVLGSSTVIGGNLVYDHTWRENRFAANYQGGGSFYDPSNPIAYGNGTFQSLSLSEEIGGGRWRIRLTDAGEYSPNASFGGAGLAGPGLLDDFGGAFTGLIPSFAGGETILTGKARRFNNTSIGEGEYKLSARTAITVAGSYGIIHFLDAGFVDNRSYLVRIGYDYELSAKSTIAAYGQTGRSYYSLFSTNSTGPGGSGTPGVLANSTDYSGGLAFSKQVTGRMAFQIAGGPDWINISPSPAGGSPSRLSWDAFATLGYAFRRSNVTLSFSRTQTPGSGVYYGSLGDLFTGGYSHNFSRFFSAGLNGGYSLNRALVTSAGFSNQFSSWYAGANLSRQLGPKMHFGVYYGVQQQLASGACPVAVCAVTTPRQTFGINLDWHPRAIAAE